MTTKFKVWSSLRLPDGSQICIAKPVSADPDKETLFQHNHSVYRVDALGNEMWQINRDDLSEDVRALHRLVLRTSPDPAYDHDNSFFVSIYLEYVDGSNSVDPETTVWKRFADWAPGAVVKGHTFDSKIYEINIETGEGKWINRPTFPQRQW